MRNLKFRSAYFKLNRENRQHIKVRNQIAFELNVSTQIVYNYLNGVTGIKEDQKPIIARIMQMEIQDLFEMEDISINA